MLSSRPRLGSLPRVTSRRPMKDFITTVQLVVGVWSGSYSVAWGVVHGSNSTLSLLAAGLSGLCLSGVVILRKYMK